MAFVPSNWKIVFDIGGPSQLVIVDHGEEIDEEMAFPWAQAVDAGKPLRAVGGKKYARGRMEVSFTVGVWKTHGSHAAARNYCLAQLAAMPTGVTDSVRIVVKDGDSYSMPDAVITSGEPRMVRGGGEIRTWQQFKIEGGKPVLI